MANFLVSRNLFTMSNNRLLLHAILLSFSSIIFAQKNSETDSINVSTNYLEEIVLSDTRIPIKRSQSGKTIIKINENQIASFSGRSLGELLETYAGINFLGSRSITGQNLRFAIRGSTNNQVLVLVDGVRVSDPSRIDNDFDFNFLNLTDISSIEVYKGAASTLYGSAAAAGVIQISTKAAKKKTLSLGFTTGTEQASKSGLKNLSYYSNQINYSDKFNRLSYKIGLSSLSTSGISSVSNGSEKDPFFRYNINAQLGYESSNFKFTLHTNKAHIENQYDNIFPVEDADFIGYSFMESISVNSVYSYEYGNLTMNAGYQKTKREYKDNYPTDYTAENCNIEFLNRLNLGVKIYSVQGLLFQKASYEGVPLVNQKDFFANIVYLSDSFNINGGARLNNHQIYGSHFTYTFNPSYLISRKNFQFKFFGSLSSAFVAPSLFQLYDTYSGNINLLPEESKSIEFGSEWVKNEASTSLVFFQRKEDPKIVYDFTLYTYANSPSNVVYQGIEYQYVNQLFDHLNFRLNYTFTELKSGTLARLPKHSLNAQLSRTLNSSSIVDLIYAYRSKRQAIDLTELNPYSLVDIRYEKEFSPKFKTSIWINNLFDTEYVEIQNYTTLGRNFRLGINYLF